MNPNNNQWVYYNGELYHAGVKGMQWGKHLPGTTWWKEAVGRYNVNNPGTKYSSVKANLYAAGQAAKLYGGYIGNNAKVLAQYGKDKVSRGYQNIKNGTSKFWNATKGYTREQINKFKESARKSYQQVRQEVHNVIEKYYNKRYMDRTNDALWTFAWSEVLHPSTSDNSLHKYFDQELEDATRAYKEAKLHSSFSNDLNLLIQTAQYDIVKGCSDFLYNIGMDKNVNNFLKKIKKKLH